MCFVPTIFREIEISNHPAFPSLITEFIAFVGVWSFVQLFVVWAYRIRAYFAGTLLLVIVSNFPSPVFSAIVVPTLRESVKKAMRLVM